MNTYYDMSIEDKETLQQKYSEICDKLETTNKQLEEANRKLKEYEEKAAKAEKASKMKSLFLANMSHEIRTPLNAIEGFSRVMVETDSQEDRMNYMEIIESNNNRLLSLVNEILDLSRVESGEIIIKNAPTDLNYLMNSIKQLFKFRCPETVNLIFKKPNSPVTMNTDENRLIQVFSNLISNALKHTSKGEISYGYQVMGETEEIQFFVKDTGSGIDPQFIDHIFDTYASKDAEQQRGFGLGLALCRIIVERMGGCIQVESKLGEGSLFTFTLPFNGSISGMAITNRANNMRTLRVNNPLDNLTLVVSLVNEHIHLESDINDFSRLYLNKIINHLIVRQILLHILRYWLGQSAGELSEMVHAKRINADLVIFFHDTESERCSIFGWHLHYPCLIVMQCDTSVLTGGIIFYNVFQLFIGRFILTAI